MKYSKIRGLSDPYFPVHEQNRIRIFPYLERNAGKYRYNSAVREQELDANK